MKSGNIGKQMKKLVSFLKARKGGCIVAAALFLACAVFLAGSNIELVGQHEARMEKERAQRQEMLGGQPEKEKTPKPEASGQAVSASAVQTKETSEPAAQEVSGEGQTAEPVQAEQPASPQPQAQTEQPPIVAQNQGASTEQQPEPAGAGADLQQPAAQDVPKAEVPTAIQAQQPQPSAASAAQEETACIMVKVTIKCDRAVDHPDLQTSAMLPEDGTILQAQTAVKKDGSVLDALEAACRDNGISYTNRGTAANAYITQIGGLSEKECGKYSGWKYQVNGTVSGKACSAYKLKDQDEVVWYYATTYTE